MAGKEKNFVSAVVYLGDEADSAAPFLSAVTGQLAARFEQYELVFVEDFSRDGTEANVKAFLAEMESPPPVTMIHMSIRQGRELAMNAGIDMAIGDFVYEFDTMQMHYPASLIDDAYDTCLKGNDIVSVSPKKNRGLGSALFYKLFNASSRSRYKLQTDVFRLLSRRAINRVHSISPTMPYRKAAYAASGLKIATLTYEGEAGRLAEHMRLSRAADSLALYTGLGYKASLVVSIAMLLFTVGVLVYTLIINLSGIVDPVPGWTTTMLVLGGGFFGVFLILAIVLKYLSLLVDMLFRKQKYLVESVEKIA